MKNKNALPGVAFLDHHVVEITAAIRACVRHHKTRGGKRFLAVGVELKYADGEPKLIAEVLDESDDALICKNMQFNAAYYGFGGPGFNSIIPEASYRDVNYDYAIIVDMNSDEYSMGAWAWRARKALGMTAPELALKAGLDKAYIHRVEVSACRPSGKAMEKIEGAFGFRYEDVPFFPKEISLDLELIVENEEPGNVVLLYRLVGALPVFIDMRLERDFVPSECDFDKSEGYMVLPDTMAADLVEAQCRFFKMPKSREEIHYEIITFNVDEMLACASENDAAKDA